jgi:hypothetical protein
MELELRHNCHHNIKVDVFIGDDWFHETISIVSYLRVFATYYHHLQEAFLPACWRSRDVITTILVIILSPADVRQIFVADCVNQGTSVREWHKWRWVPAIFADEFH